MFVIGHDNNATVNDLYDATVNDLYDATVNDLYHATVNDLYDATYMSHMSAAYYIGSFVSAFKCLLCLLLLVVGPELTISANLTLMNILDEFLR